VGDASIVALQERLAALGYDVGAADGRMGERTSASIMAFQKVEGLARTGAPGPSVDSALASASPPRPLVPGGEATRVEIDLRRQVLLYWTDGHLARVLPVSTGSGRRYCLAGVCERAVTPTGVFHVGRKVPGVDPGPLGPLYYPMYFNGGIAIHGAPSVPASPASHGCTRIPMYAAASFFQQVPPGTAVYVV
jgi:peptidoglycan hydrolase-like protein with peptidoglycan-binding domain